MTGLESKRKVLQNVVANAMRSDEPIDMEQLKVMALAELDAPEVQAIEPDSGNLKSLSDGTV